MGQSRTATAAPLALSPRRNSNAGAATGLGLLGSQKDVVAIDRFTRLPTPVQVESELVRLEDGKPVARMVVYEAAERNPLKK